jgi:sugar phosphate isomerase/epimerase
MSNIQTSRRGFLGTAAGLAGFSAVASRPASARIEPEPWGIKLGVATYSFRNFDRAKTIEMVKALQTPWVSVKDVDKQLSHKMSPEELRQARKEFDDAGLKVMSVGNVDMKKATTPEAMREIFEWAKNFGAPMMVCIPSHETVKLLEPLVKEYNIKVAIHNHGPEEKDFPTPQSVLEVVKNLDPRCGLCMDIGHTERTGTDPVKAAAEAGSRLLDMHCKDLTDLRNKDSQCDVGDGAIPFPALFKQLKKMGYKGCVNLEYEIHADNPLPGMQRSFSYMRGVLAGLAAA